MSYTKQEIIDKCETEIKNCNTFYQKGFVNYTGKTSDAKEYYSEIIAEFLCQNLDKFKSGINPISRTSPYKVDHDGHYNPSSNREEEITAIQIWNSKCNYDFIGEVLQYQIPLKSSIKDKKTGKIDLLSYNKEKGTLHILELKKQKSHETMLRCVLEGYTYLQIVDQNKLIDKDNFNLPKNTKVVANPLVFKGSDSRPYREMLQPGRKWLRKLMSALNSTPFYLTENNGQYFVTDK